MIFSVDAWTALVGLAWASLALWLGAALLTLRGLLRQQPLAPIETEELTGGDAPLLSVLVPARNEEHRVLEEAVRSMLGQDYGRLEVVAVNDRSDDATGPILRSIAREDEKLRVLEGIEPPAGWLGKPHALQQALGSARGEWVLATDADMIFEKRAVRTAVRHALAGRFDAVTLVPHIICLSFWERVFMPVFGWFMLIVLPLERVNDPRKAEAIGVGGFFLIRRETLERIGGYRAVQNEVAEDLRLAEILKSAGARIRLEHAPALTRTRMQTNLREIWEGFTKNLFAGARFSLLHTLAGSAGALMFMVAPPVLAFLSAVALATDAHGAWAELFWPTFLVWLVQVGTFAVINRYSGVPTSYAVTVPLGHLLFVGILLNSAIRIASGSGVTWKGRKLYERAGVRPPRRGSGR